jgi:NADH dehydrogenase [ubiquinone] 1 alpha subcomplex assembly factor 7
MLHSAGHFIRRCSSTLSRLRTAIKATGPLTVADFMKESLSNPLTGYYMKQTAIGKDGDFVTSPEISQVFGELLGVWIMADWMIQGQPNPCHVIELGPGNGSLINDIIRVFSQLKDILPAAVVHLVEISPRMKKRQQGLLNNSQNEQIDEDTICLPNGLIINWYSSLSSVPRGYSYYIAHEFFDVLPVHQFMKTKSNEWREVLVDIDTTAQNNEGDLRYVIAPGRTPALTYCSLLDENVREGEVSPQALMIMDEISKRVREFGGAALIADYGEEKIDKFTLRVS